MQKAIFIDKDGTLIKDVPYNVDPDLINLEKDCIEGLQRFKMLGYKLIIISNQSGVARGYFEESALKNVESKIKDLLTEHGISLNGFYYCPHHPEGTVTRYKKVCDCRKPNPGMILRAARENKIDLSHSFMIGDILNDIEAGKRAGCKTILIDNGNETEWIMNAYNHPDFTVKNINEAASKV